ncbi:hypothetical protein D6817_03520 [Candidatus Pacearchaeota archaeon]|nr:MAG: hypothetical protein D6817_03520 [Candidatus Pacearchaeota archaeon]
MMKTKKSQIGKQMSWVIVFILVFFMMFVFNMLAYGLIGVKSLSESAQPKPAVPYLGPEENIVLKEVHYLRDGVVTKSLFLDILVDYLNGKIDLEELASKSREVFNSEERACAIFLISDMDGNTIKNFEIGPSNTDFLVLPDSFSPSENRPWRLIFTKPDNSQVLVRYFWPVQCISSAIFENPSRGKNE